MVSAGRRQAGQALLGAAAVWVIAAQRVRQWRRQRSYRAASWGRRAGTTSCGRQARSELNTLLNQLMISADQLVGLCVAELTGGGQHEQAGVDTIAESGQVKLQ